MVRWVCMVLVTGCAAVDLEVAQSIAEVTVEGDALAHRAGIRLPSDLIPPQQWETELPGIPAGIFLARLELRITPTGDADGRDDLEFLHSVIFYVESSAEGSTLPRRPLAWSDGPLSGRSATLVPNQALDLLPYVLEGVQLSSEVEGVMPPTTLTFDGHAVLFVDAI